MSNYYVGIDCGLSGAITVIDDGGLIVRKIRMPVMKKGKGNKIDLSELYLLLWNPSGGDIDKRKNHIIGVEDPGGHAPSAAGLRGMTYCFAAVEMAIVALRHRHAIYMAKEWQSTFWKKPKMPKGQKFDTKAAALAAAKRLWPTESFLASARSSKPHDGIVDALLIAEHTRRQFR